MGEPEATRLADSTIQYGWYSSSDRRLVPIVGEIDWTESTHDSTTRAALDAWEPLDPVLLAHSYDPKRSLDEAAAYAAQWIELGRDLTAPDLGVAGRRALRLAYVAAATGAAELVHHAASTATELLHAIDPADTKLATTEAVTGLVTLVGRLSGGLDALSIAPEDTSDILAAHLEASFSSDGIHRSRTPGVHAQVMERVAVLRASGLLPASLLGLIGRAERALAWLLDPTGAPANIGATTTEPITTAYGLKPSGLRFLPDRVADPALLHATSAGRFGTPPGHPIGVFPGGFAAIKTPWPDREWGTSAASHLVLQTAVDSDDTAGLVVTWHDLGHRLLVEPGPVLERSAHPAAHYAANGSAHNTVLVDDVPLGRGNGSLSRWGSVRGTLHLQATHSSSAGSHRRTTILHPGRWLLVVDQVQADPAANVGVRFHVGDELDVMASGSGYILLQSARPAAWVIPLGDGNPMVPLRGVQEPEPNGWWSPDGDRMVPNWALGWDGSGTTTFATLFSLGVRPVPELVADPWIAWITGDYRARVALTEWGVSDIVIDATSDEEDD